MNEKEILLEILIQISKLKNEIYYKKKIK